MSTKTTTDAGASSRPVPKMRLSAFEWRLYLSSLLAGAYVFAWIAFAAPPRGTAEADVAEALAPPDLRASAGVSTRRRFVWITDLPVAERPAVSLPPGWTIAERSQTPRSAVVRRAAAARPRIRTRSS